ncbi:RNase adapter RapZ [Marivivens sp. JLT3646]|uniref:RNase adapter RapZ n=1 Tax=Marivivens sp. JLT3646 TaxID=1920883 RepID=UPI0008001FC1|nr:RNase adapter RapZ [Marivivens sp. JLT3646]APO85738.1 RNase adaptor protein RapZ [Marivivens sp. JLT3646]OBR38286.1 RNase adaptor protein RapZ [Donghicola sp. JL3646]
MTSKQSIILVTGPSGAGRTTAVRALEDIGFEVIDNMPLSLIDRVIEGQPLDRPLVLGLDVRNRDFTVNAVIGVIDRLGHDERFDLQVVYMDCSDDVLIRRFSETRRRHPLSVETAPTEGIIKEKELLIPIRSRADILIDTTTMTPHDSRAEVQNWFQKPDGHPLAITVQSFSYKRGLPRGLDIVLDCRFLRNPHWEPELRALNGQDAAVVEYIAKDERFDAFFTSVKAMAALLLPAFEEEGKTHLSVGFGCTGGQHRSVAMTELLAKALAEDGWQVSKRHREMERHTDVGAADRG